MIPELYVEQWKAEAPWVMLSMVEQDMVISRALIALYNQPAIASTLAFRGGTALNKLFIRPAARYSEDLDFVQIRQEPIGNTLDMIRSILDPWLGVPKRKLTQRSAKLLYRYEALDQTRARLKIEINTSEHFQVESLQYYPFFMSSEWFSGQAKITSYTLNELMGTKLRALYQRRKGRDLFDLWWVLSKELVDVGRMVNVFDQYNAHNKMPVSRAQFEENLYLKQQNKDFTSDIEVLLRPSALWDFDEALSAVKEKVVSQLEGEAWKGGVK